MRAIMPVIGLSTVAGVLNAASFTVNGDAAAAVSVLIATVVITLSTVKWIDSRIEKKLRLHEERETMEHRAIVREISTLRVIFGHDPLNIDDILAPEPEKG